MTNQPRTNRITRLGSCILIMLLISNTICSCSQMETNYYELLEVCPMMERLLGKSRYEAEDLAEDFFDTELEQKSVEPDDDVYDYTYKSQETLIINGIAVDSVVMVCDGIDDTVYKVVLYFDCNDSKEVEMYCQDYADYIENTYDYITGVEYTDSFYISNYKTQSGNEFFLGSSNNVFFLKCIDQKATDSSEKG